MLLLCLLWARSDTDIFGLLWSLQERELDDDLSKGVKAALASGPKAGWGSWAGLGAAPQKPNKRVLAAAAKAEQEAIKAKRARLDAQLPTVIINEKRQKRSASLKIAQVRVCSLLAEAFGVSRWLSCCALVLFVMCRCRTRSQARSSMSGL
jgi:hypothetical protein